MTVEKVIWTALPRGVDEDGRLRISVHVAPRLRNDDGSDTQRKLGEFAAFANWPERVNTFRFSVEFDGGPSAKGVPEAPADPKLWSLLLPGDTRVGPHVFQDHAKRDLHVFPVRPLLKFIKQAYGEAAVAGTDLPSIDDAFGPLAPFAPLKDIPNRIVDSQSVHDELARAQEDKKTISDGHVVVEDMADSSLPGHAQEAQNNFFQAYRFYSRPGSRRPDFPEDYIEPSPKPHDFEFHEILSGLADHPLLLRRLGVVIDLVVEVEAAAIPATGVVRVVPRGELPETPPVCPDTSYDFDGRWFGARPVSNFRMTRGILRLSSDAYDLFQVDIDGAAMQAVNFSTTLDALKNPERRSEASEDETGIPALRSTGLALARTRRGDSLLEDLKARRSKNENLEKGKPVVFNAEDLVRGYRIDVFDDKAPGGPAWFSLHRRVTAHAFKAPPDGEVPEPLTLTDEAYLKATTASSETKEHPTPSDDLYLHETIAGWDGWSLAASRPGKRIVEPGQGDTPDGSIARYDPEIGNPFPIVSRVSVEPGTLPRLRVGHTYRMRIRTVDLAGNSLPFDNRDLEPPDPQLASESQRYVRFEPVPSPTVIRRHLDTEGESLENLTIRSNLGVSAADYVQRPEVVQALAQAGASHTYAEDSQRHLAPPKASQQMAEQDGRFDVGFGGTPAQATAALRVALREEGTFLDPTIVDVTTGQKTIAQAAIKLFPTGTPMPPTRGAGLPGGAYAFYPDPGVTLPYLPDPLAIGVSLTGHDFTGNEVFQVAKFSGTWPSLTPFRLRLSEGPLGVAFTANVLEVRLPKAEVVWARLASVFPAGRLDDLAIWQWVPDPDKTPALKTAALEGRHWMLTPFREVIFTHAVQQPLVVPNMTKVESSRSLGDTFAAFRGPIANHAMSTGRLDVFGAWTEDVDLVTDDEPRMRAFGSEVPHQAQAFGFEIRRSDNEAEVAAHQARHEFGDTKYRRIVYHSVATTRFREFLPRPLTDVPANIQRVESGTDANDQSKPALVHDILSSARPAAPEVLYVLPTFRWERQDEGSHRAHVRHGNAVRVWLRRPWFSSGDGEQLGVVLEPAVRLPRGWERMAATDVTAKVFLRQPQINVVPRGGRIAPRQPNRIMESSVEPTSGFLTHAGSMVTTELLGLLGAPKPTSEQIRKMLRPYVTAWGSDPVWKSAPPTLPPTVGDFPRHTAYATGLTLAELPSTVKVNVAAHDVHFDRERRLWYCDIEIDAGNSYYPFVRLALARYQAHSLTHAHLSRVVMTDFIQLAPDRTADVVLSPGSAVVTVQGFAGRNYVADVSPFPFADPELFKPGTAPNTKMRATLERRMEGVPGDLGWERVGAEVELSAAVSGFRVTWTGTLQLPADLDDAGRGYRLLITESEVFLRDLMAGDPMVSTSLRDYVRERVVYADTFEI